MTNGIWVLEAKGTNKLGKGTQPMQPLWDLDLQGQRLLRKIGVIDASLGEGCFSKAILLNSPADCTCGTPVH